LEVVRPRREAVHPNASNDGATYMRSLDSALPTRTEGTETEGSEHRSWGPQQPVAWQVAECRVLRLTNRHFLRNGLYATTQPLDTMPSELLTAI
jgi:hypothetical protein